MNNFPFLNITYAPSFFKFQFQKRKFHSSHIVSLIYNIKKFNYFFYNKNKNKNINNTKLITTKSDHTSYKINSSIYKVLISNLTSDPLDKNTQIKIEKYLKNDYLNSFLEKN